MNDTQQTVKLAFTPPEDEEGGTFTKVLFRQDPVFVYTPGVASLIEKQGIGPDQLFVKTRELVEHKDNLDYLQIAHIGETKVWIIDDGQVITWLLPEEY